ncbi:MAG TPA: trypsin-like peptidase domain-containing protein, partial [Polyangiaceae bacterium]
MKLGLASFVVASALSSALVGCGPPSAAKSGGESARAEAAPEKKASTPADIAEAALPSVVAVVTEDSLGSGFVVGADGLVATNLHVIAGYAKAIVVLHDRREFPVVEIYNADPRRDIAILHIEAQGLKPLALGDSDHVRAGESVVAIGHPLGLTDTVSSGLVGA